MGHRCPEGTAHPVSCEPGTFTATTLSAVCLACPAGRYCIPGAGPAPCPAGFYCPEGTGAAWPPCPVGTFSPVTSLANSSACAQCTPGAYCESANQTVVSGPCNAGFFCASGADAPAPTGLTAGHAGTCPPGHFCEAGTGEPVACPAGTYNNASGATARADCRDCPPGDYCDRAGGDAPAGPCEAGFYCAGGANASRPADHTPTGGPCPAGSFCVAGASAPQPCVAGSFAPVGRADRCDGCPAGYYCPTGADNATDCPRGERHAPPNTAAGGTYPVADRFKGPCCGWEFEHRPGAV